MTSDADLVAWLRMREEVFSGALRNEVADRLEALAVERDQARAQAFREAAEWCENAGLCGPDGGYADAMGEGMDHFRALAEQAEKEQA